MNRIILIGNGFDLAHEIETSYTQFLNDYWRNISEKLGNMNSNPFGNDQIKISNFPLGIRNYFDFNQLNNYLKDNNCKIEFKNNFFEHINIKKNLNNWVDIENEYYEIITSYLDDIDKSKWKDVVNKLNKEFREIQNLLEKYLDKVWKNRSLNNNHHYDIGKKIYSRFNLDDFTNEGGIQIISEKKGKLVKEISNKCNLSNDELFKLEMIDNSMKDDLVSEILNSPRIRNNVDLRPKEILFLNFNYTKTCNLYFKEHLPLDSGIKGLSYQAVNIHGEIFNDKNPIIFGYGDELDEKYKLLERANENDFLENIKSIKYLETSNYKKLLQFVESDNYQVYIMGHSCGTSDRTLLNSLFENENCLSIKFFYHKMKNGEDNYSDIIRNISRNFNNKVIMRDKVVNKEYCEPLLNN